MVGLLSLKSVKFKVVIEVVVHGRNEYFRHQIVVLLSYLLSLWINLSKTWLWNDICIIYHVKIVIMRPNFDFTLVCLRVVIFGVEHHDFNVILYQIVLIWAALLNPLACIRMSHISTLFIDKCEIPLFGQLLPLYTIFVVISHWLSSLLWNGLTMFISLLDLVQKWLLVIAAGQWHGKSTGHNQDEERHDNN